MMNDKIKKAIQEYLEEASSQTILDLVNEIYNHTGELSDLVWEDMENFNEYCQDMEPHKMLRDCNKAQLNQIAAELETVKKRLEWIIEGRY